MTAIVVADQAAGTAAMKLAERLEPPVTAELGMIVDPAVIGEETLAVAGRFEPLHLPLSLSRRWCETLAQWLR
jgi:hypothetical protein